MRHFTEGYREEFKDNADTWKALDAKAQGVGGFAAAFLAVCFAFAREPKALTGAQCVGVIVVLLFLVLSVATALLSLQLREVLQAPIGSAIADHERRTLAVINQDGAERLVGMHQDALKMWKQVNAQISISISKKACWLAKAQVSMVCAAIGSAVLTIVTLKQW